MNNNTEKHEEITVEEFVARLKQLKVKTETELEKAQEKLDDLEASEPDCDGAKYERWQEKYDSQQLIVDTLEENMEKINRYLAEYDTAEV